MTDNRGINHEKQMQLKMEAKAALAKAKAMNKPVVYLKKNKK